MSGRIAFGLARIPKGYVQGCALNLLSTQRPRSCKAPRFILGSIGKLYYDFSQLTCKRTFWVIPSLPIPTSKAPLVLAPAAIRLPANSMPLPWRGPVHYRRFFCRAVGGMVVKHIELMTLGTPIKKVGGDCQDDNGERIDGCRTNPSTLRRVPVG
jgi:hypothetical protein